MPHSTLLILVLFTAALVALSWLRRVAVLGTWATLLRALFPSWRFFESNESSYVVLARTAEEGAEPGDFLPVLEGPHRSLVSIVFAPRPNLLLACHDLVEALVSELDQQGPLSLPQAEQLVSYRLVRNMVAYFVRERAAGVTGLHFQLKLVCTSPSQADEELFTSPFYAAA